MMFYVEGWVPLSSVTRWALNKFRHEYIQDFMKIYPLERVSAAIISPVKYIQKDGITYADESEDYFSEQPCGEQKERWEARSDAMCRARRDALGFVWMSVDRCSNYGVLASSGSVVLTSREMLAHSWNDSAEGHHVNLEIGTVGSAITDMWGFRDNVPHGDVELMSDRHSQTYGPLNKCTILLPDNEISGFCAEIDTTIRLSGGSTSQKLDDEQQITVRDEAEAVLSCQKILDADIDGNIRQSDLKVRVAPEMGARAWRRVIDNVRKTHPQISRPGAKRK